MEDLSHLPVGSRLKKARELKRLSLEQVHESIKVPIDSLRAIEEGYTVRTLSPFYYKGFVKIYGQHLGVDVSDVLEASQKERLQKSEEPSSTYFERTNAWKSVITKDHVKQAALVVGVLLCVFFVAKMVDGFMHRKPKVTVEVPTAVVDPETQEAQRVVVRKPAVAPKVKEEVKQVAEEPPTTSRRRKKAEPKEEVKEVAKVDPRKEIKQEAKVAVPPPVEQVVQTREAPIAVSSPAKSGKNVVLTARARKESWLRVKADDQVVFQSTLEVGSVETWMANEKIEISGKNLNQLEFELNGKMVGSLGRKSSKAKMLVVTKDGLNVTQ